MDLQTPIIFATQKTRKRKNRQSVKNGNVFQGKKQNGCALPKTIGEKQTNLFPVMLIMSFYLSIIRRKNEIGVMIGKCTWMDISLHIDNNKPQNRKGCI